ncbi:MAG: hypothetical protein IPO27_13290 [Bacteroidetes bacterium]|nr:hypothetical protein [Bacteroidota bacterium]
MIKKNILIVLVVMGILPVLAQTNQHLVQFTGVVVTGDSLQPVPFATVMVRGRSSGTVSDFMDFSPLLHAKAIPLTLPALDLDRPISLLLIHLAKINIR